jgi:hypothetical protein
MGIASKAFLKLNGIESVSKSRTANLGAIPQRNFGGLIRKAADSAQVASAGRRTSASELGTVAKAKDAKGHGSEKRGGSSTPVDYAALHRQYMSNEDVNAHSENAHLLATHFGTPEEADRVKQGIALRDKEGGYQGKAGMDAYRFNGEIDAKYYPKLQEAAGVNVGKSLSIFGLMQTLSKAGTSEGVKRSWETRRGGLASSVEQGSSAPHEITEMARGTVSEPRIQEHNEASAQARGAAVTREANKDYRMQSDTAEYASKRANQAQNRGSKEQTLGELHSWAAQEHKEAASRAQNAGMVDRAGYHEGKAREHTQNAKDLGGGASISPQRMQQLRDEDAGVSYRRGDVKSRVAGPDIASVKREYDANEDENRHSENAALLAHHFGTDEEKATAKGHIESRDRLGHGSLEGVKFQSQMSEKYYNKLGGGKGMTFGKSLGFLSAMQCLAKAKDAKGQGSEKRGGGGSGGDDEAASCW